jgi:hypothetical protein
LLAEVASQTGILQPLQPYMIPNLNILDKVALCNDNASTFMATNEWELPDQWPITIDCVQVCVADTCLVFSFKNEYITMK